MLRLHRLFFVFLFFCFTLQAEEESSSQDYLNIGNELVGGCIDPLSGAYIDREVDIAIPGAVNLNIERYYNSNTPFVVNKIEGWDGVPVSKYPLNMFFMWSWNHSTLIEWLKHDRSLITSNSSGRRVDFHIHANQPDALVHETALPHANHFTHWTNCHGNSIGACIDLHNSKAIDKNQTNWSVQEPSGITHIYKGPQAGRKIKKACFQELRSESERIFPSGCEWLYFHNNDNSFILNRVEACNRKKQKIGSLEISSHRDKNSFIKSSTGDWVRYTLQHFDCGYIDADVPVKVERSQKPTIEYVYNKNSIGYGCGQLFYEIVEKRLPDNRYRKIRYNRTDAPGRVEAYSGPGAKGKDVDFYTFQYEAVPYGYNEKGLKTTVKEATGAKSVYEYGKDGRLKSVSRYNAKNELQFSRHTKWSEDKTAGRLISYWLKNSQGKVEIVKKCDYDDFGNVIKETSWAKLSEDSSFPEVDENGIVQNPDKTDFQEIFFEFYQEPFHVKKSQTHPNGKSERFTYETGTDLVETKIVSWAGKDVERYSYTYDDFGEVSLAVFEELSSDESELGAVLQKTFERTKRYDSGLFIGLVAQLDIGYIDLQTSAENILSSTTYQYNSKRQIRSQSRVDAITKQTTLFTYERDDHGNCLLENTPEGGVIERRYDANDNLVFQKGPTPEVSIEFEYDLNNRLIKKSQKHPEVTLVESFEYDDMGHLIAKESACGICEELEYDSEGRLLVRKVSGASDVANQDQPLASKPYQKSFAYDVFGRKIKEVDERGYSTEYLYNGFGEILYQKNPDGSHVRYVYDDKGFLTKKTYNDLWSETFFYDEIGRLTAVYREEGSTHTLAKQFSYRGSKLVSQIDALGHEDRFEYDGAGRKVKHWRIDGQTGLSSCEEWQYTGLDQVSCYRRWQNETDYVEEYTYYNSDGTVREKFHKNNLGIVQGRVVYHRNLLGNVLKETHFCDGRESEKSWTYNSIGHVLSHKDEFGFVTSYQYDYLVHGVSGLKGTLIQEFKPNGDHSWIWKDPYNRPAEIKLWDSKEDLIQHVYLGYDESSHLVYREEKSLCQGVFSAEPVITSIKYGVADQILERFDAKDSVDQRYREWTYDLIGRCLSKIEPSGLTHYYTYDAMGRLIRSWTSDGSVDYEYTYDELGYTLCVKNNLTSKETLRTYDAWGRVIQETLENGWNYSFEYDCLDQVVKEIYEDGSFVNREYIGGHLRSVTRNGAQTYTHTIDKRDSQGRSLTETMPFAIGTINRLYDVKGRPTSLKRPFYKADNITYDALDRLTTRRIEDQMGVTSELYAYDALDQLVYESGLEEHTYLNDSRKRRTLKDECQFELDSLDQIIATHEGISLNFQYDLEGRLIFFETQEGPVSLTYDAWSRLLSVKSQKIQADYEYDAYDRRMKKEVRSFSANELVSSQEVQFGYLNRRLVSIETGGQRDHRVFIACEGSEQGNTLSWERGQAVCLPILDLVGSTVGWLNEAGEILGAWRYDAFGLAIGEEVGPWGYASKYKDDETSFIDYGRRFYCPEWGRWLTRDPKGEIDGSNLYSFVGNNPLNKQDSWGLFMIGSFDESGFHDKIFGFGSFHETSPGGSGSVDKGSSIGVGNCEPPLPDYVQKTQYANVLKVSPEANLRSNSDSKKENGTFVNGSATTLEEAIKVAKEIADDTGLDVYLAHIPTKGLFIDLTLAFFERVGLLKVPASHAEICKNACLAATEGGYTNYLFCHSRGLHAVKAANEEYGAIHKEAFGRTQVLGLAGSWDIPSINAFKDVINTVCLQDLAVRLFDNGAIDRQRENGMLIEVEFCGGKPSIFPLGHMLTSPTMIKTMNGYIEKIREKHE